MPRNAKKRKVSKKKKNIVANTNSGTSYGYGTNLKPQESNVGEVSYPASEEEQCILPVRSTGSENGSMQVWYNDGEALFYKVVENDVGGILVAKDLNIKQNLETKDLSIKKLHNLSSSACNKSSRNCGSLDDKSRVVEKYSVASEGNALVTEACDSLMETKTLDEFAKFENSVNSNVDVAELGIKENDERLVPSNDEKTEDSKKIEDKLSSTTFENETVSKENGDKMLQSSNELVLETSTYEEHIRGSENLECNENESVVAAAQGKVQTTSWKSCCGLFEVLMGSNK